MTSTTPPRPPGRPTDPAKAPAILDAAWRLFLARGVEATPIEAIAAAAKVSKVTLYRHYKDKTALFEAAMLREMERIEAAQRSGGADRVGAAIAERLSGFGLGVMGFLATPPAIDFYNVIAGELRRHPALARAFYDLGPGRTRANLATLIAGAAKAGELDVDDPEQAAETLFGLWQGFSNFQLSLGVGAAGFSDDLEGRVARGVSAFMRLYSPSRNATAR